MKIKLIKLIDRLAGGIAAACLPCPQPRPVPFPRQFLFIRPGGIGDAVLLLPALRVLKAAFPGCSIDILAEHRNAAAFELSPGIRTVHRYDSLPGIASVLSGRYDVVIDTEQWHRLSAVVARLTRAPMLIGFGTNERRRLFTHPVSYSLEQYEACSFFRLLEPLGVPAPAGIDAPFLTLPAAAAEAAQGLLAPLSGRPFLTVFPGASVAEKQWGMKNFRELTAKLAAGGIGVVIAGGEDTWAAGEEIANGGVALNLAGRASLAETAALIGKGRALVSGDSGLLHIAAGLGTPTVSLFGPSDPRKWGPKGESHLALSAGLPCAPCARFGKVPSCPIGARCLSAVTVAEVFAAIQKSLAGRPARGMFS